MRKSQFIALLQMLEGNQIRISGKDLMKELVRNVEAQKGIRNKANDLLKQHHELIEKMDFFENTHQKDELEKIQKKDERLHGKFMQAGEELMQSVGKTSMFIDMAVRENRNFILN